MLSVLARSTRLESSDHMNHDTEDASSGGIVAFRIVSRERVARIMSFVGRMIAMYAPFGLGTHCVDAVESCQFRIDRADSPMIITLQSPGIPHLNLLF